MVVESSVVQEIDTLPFWRDLATEASNICVPDELVRCARRDCLNSALVSFAFAARSEFPRSQIGRNRGRIGEDPDVRRSKAI